MSATEAQAEIAIGTLKRMIEAAENGNQAGEDAVVAAAAGLELLTACQAELVAVRQDVRWADDCELGAMYLRQARLEEVIARATGAA